MFFMILNRKFSIDIAVIKEDYENAIDLFDNSEEPKGEQKQ